MKDIEINKVYKIKLSTGSTCLHKVKEVKDDHLWGRDTIFFSGKMVREDGFLDTSNVEKVSTPTSWELCWYKKHIEGDYFQTEYFEERIPIYLKDYPEDTKESLEKKLTDIKYIVNDPVWDEEEQCYWIKEQQDENATKDL